MTRAVHHSTAGLTVIRRHSRSIAVVLLDLTMPGMSGFEVLRELRTTFPEVPVVPMSGYDEAERQRLYPEEDNTGFLAKPFRREELIACVRQALGRVGQS